MVPMRMRPCVASQVITPVLALAVFRVALAPLIGSRCLEKNRKSQRVTRGGRGGGRRGTVPGTGRGRGQGRGPAGGVGGGGAGKQRERTFTLPRGTGDESTTAVVRSGNGCNFCESRTTNVQLLEDKCQG